MLRIQISDPHTKGGHKEVEMGEGRGERWKNAVDYRTVHRGYTQYLFDGMCRSWIY